jgi:hypothetical protein
MKKLLTAPGFLVMMGTLFLFAFFTGCSDDTEEEPVHQFDMVGFWTVDEIDISSVSVGDQSIVDFFISVGGMSQEEANLAYTLLESTIKASISGTIEIRADQTYTSILGGEITDGTWAQSADGKTFTIYDDTPDEFVATINTRTDSMATITFVYDTYQDIDMDPQTPDVLLTVEGDITLVK